MKRKLPGGCLKKKYHSALSYSFMSYSFMHASISPPLTPCSLPYRQISSLGAFPHGQ